MRMTVVWGIWGIDRIEIDDVKSSSEQEGGVDSELYDTT